MSVADEVRRYIEKRPYVQEALCQGIVNYSALARKIEGEVSGGFEAVKIALRRIKEDLVEYRGWMENNVMDVVGGTAVELKSNVKVCKTDNMEKDADVFAKTENGYTLVLEEDGECRGEIIDNQVLITLKSPESLEDTPGVLSYILEIFAGAGINVTELISCREDTHIVIDSGNASEAFEMLNERLENED